MCFLLKSFEWVCIFCDNHVKSEQNSICSGQIGSECFCTFAISLSWICTIHSWRSTRTARPYGLVCVRWNGQSPVFVVILRKHLRQLHCAESRSVLTKEEAVVLKGVLGFWLWGEKSARRDCGREMTRDLFPLYTYYCFNSHHRYRCLLMLWDAAYSKLCYDHGFSSCIFFLKIILMCQCYHTIRCLLWNTRTELGRKQISWILDSLSFHCITRAVIFCIF